MNELDDALRQIATKQREVEEKFPRTADPNSCDDAFLHGKWRGLSIALDILQEQRGAEIDI